MLCWIPSHIQCNVTNISVSGVVLRNIPLLTFEVRILEIHLFEQCVVSYCIILVFHRGKGNLCFLVKRNWKSVVLCSVGWLELKWNSVSLDYGFFSISFSNRREVLCIRKAKKLMLASFSYVGLNFQLLWINLVKIVICGWRIILWPLITLKINFKHIFTWMKIGEFL